MSLRRSCLHSLSLVTAASIATLSSWAVAPTFAQQNGDKPFHALVTDAKDMQTDLKNVVFYWEEKVSETSFIPHELKHLPVKRGTATVNIKFETIKQIEVKPSADKALPAMTVTLANGKAGEFIPAVHGSFKGESDFGPVEVPVTGVSKVMLR